MSRRTAITTTATCAVDFWEKPSGAWTERERERLLTDSPWAGAGSIRYIEMKGASSLSSMQAATFLLREGKPPLGAIEVKGWDDYDKRRDRFAMVLSYAFPASEPIARADKEVTFVTRTCGTGWVPGTARQDCMYDIRRTFKLKDMLVRGELAL